MAGPSDDLEMADHLQLLNHFDYTGFEDGIPSVPFRVWDDRGASSLVFSMPSTTVSGSAVDKSNVYLNYGDNGERKEVYMNCDASSVATIGSVSYLSLTYSLSTPPPVIKEGVVYRAVTAAPVTTKLSADVTVLSRGSILRVQRE